MSLSEPAAGIDLPAEVDLVVIGAGLMGSMTAWAATRRGLTVLALEQFAVGHDRGSSHGSARIVRRAYPDEFYVRLTGRAFELWNELENNSGTRLLTMTGGLDHGGIRDLRAIVEALTAQGVEHQVLPGAEAESRWPGMRFEKEVLFHPQAGTVDADLAVRTALDVAAAGGARIFANTAALSISVEGDTAVVETSSGSVRAGRVVLAAGAWLGDLGRAVSGLSLTLPPLRVSQQQIFHFARSAGIEEWPTSVHKGATISTYSLAGGRDGGPGGARKVAEHDPGGYDTTAGTRTGIVDPGARQRIVDYVREWMPGLVAEPFAEASCLYTNTENEDFVLDRVGPVVVCSPCSGHGAKFAPLIGELVTDLVTGTADPEPRFAQAAHRR
ncbi:sarcosine oxidase [Nakamurella sp. UYEF19]|uniref:FAD-dependent oxidoreductase n=1 Tax=Nakamurella sp. UYEF19 TaxID=1756392 RepID=UPI003393E683